MGHLGGRVLLWPHFSLIYSPNSIERFWYLSTDVALKPAMP